MLIRIHTADYGNDAINWEASNSGGTPGQANLVIDTLPPTVPTNLAGQALVSPASEISLAWNASSDLQSYVDHYVIYRSGIAVGTSTTTSFVDTTIAAGTNYTYTVAAVNRDGYSSAQSTSISIGLPSVVSSTEPASTQVVIYFSEPLTTTPATTPSNYSVSGETVSSVAISRHNTEVTLTVSSAMTLNSSYTVAMKNLTTVSGDPLPATDTYTFTYAPPAWTATMYQANWGTLGSLTDATSVVESVADQSWSQAFAPATLDFTTGNSTGLGHFANDTLMSSQTSLSEDLTDIVIAASANVYIPAAGNYTFDCASDDGFGLTIPGVTFTTLTHATNSAGSDQMQYNGGRGTADTLGVVNFPAAGYYPLSVLYFNGSGSGSLELSAAAGSYTAWSSAFKLVGDSPDGGLALGGAVVDTTTPPAPANLQATVTGGNTQITLAWSPVTGLPSGVDHYNIYRNGSLYAASTATSFVDTSGISSQSRCSYQVTAVNYDGVEGLKSAAITVAPAGIAAIITPTAASVDVQFTEPVDPATAQTAANYAISGGVAVAAAVLQSDGYTVALTTSALGTSSRTLTVSNVKTLDLAALPTNFLIANFTCLGNTSTPPPFSIGVTAEFTNAASPGLSGTVTDTVASVTVRVNGVCYAAVNNGAGAWSLPPGDISALAPAPTTSSRPRSTRPGLRPSPPRPTSWLSTRPRRRYPLPAPHRRRSRRLGSIAIHFTEPVKNFTVQDLQLTLADGGPVASEPLEGESSPAATARTGRSATSPASRVPRAPTS